MALTISSAAVDPSGTFIVFTVAGATLPLKPTRNITGINLIVNGSAMEENFSDPEGLRGQVPSGFAIAPSVVIASTDTVSYYIEDSNLTDSAGTPNTLANIAIGSAVTVTNNSAQTTDAHDLSPIGDAINDNNVGLSDYIEKTNDAAEGA